MKLVKRQSQANDKQLNKTIQDLADTQLEHGKVLGHQNHRLKIQHLVKIKKENVALMNKNSKLQSEVARLKKALKFLNAQDKENNAATSGSTRTRSWGGSMMVLQLKQQSVTGPMSSLLLEALRRQTLAVSPLGGSAANCRA